MRLLSELPLRSQSIKTIFKPVLPEAGWLLIGRDDDARGDHEWSLPACGIKIGTLK